jgi:hypothetical protein
LSCRHFIEDAINSQSFGASMFLFAVALGRLLRF